MTKKGYCVALTGGIACGKSTVAETWRRCGADILDADAVGHELIAPGGECTEAVVREFGPEVRAADGGVDRARLGTLVFADLHARARLNGLLHPAVIRRVRAWAADIRRQGRLGVAVIPLLYEVGFEKEWELLRLPVKLTGFLLLHVPVLIILFWGLLEVDRLSVPGLVIGAIAGAGGMVPLLVHKIFFYHKGRFSLAISNLVIFLNAAAGLTTLILSIRAY